MMRTYAWLLVGLLGCTRADGTQELEAQPEPIVVTAQARMPAPTPAPTPPSPAPSPPPSRHASKVTVVMTAATLADDCGHSAPMPGPKKAKAKGKPGATYAKADRACDQTSMQLSVTAAAGGAATRIAVKSVELFDDKGVKIGTLTPRSPTIWMSDGTYKAWDEKTTPGQELAVSYALSQPTWKNVADRRNRMYVLKAVVTIGGGEQVVTRDVQVAAPTALPPGVKT